jgi:hypothetical protein
MRPKSVAQVAELTLRGESFDLCLRNFLDEFYHFPTQNALAVEPASLNETFPEKGAVYDAYLAATAEALAGHAGLNTPSWAYAESRKLRHPWFALTFASMRAVLLVESPAPFRSRNLFVSENALSRA